MGRTRICTSENTCKGRTTATIEAVKEIFNRVDLPTQQPCTPAGDRHLSASPIPHCLTLVGVPDQQVGSTITETTLVLFAV